MGKRLTMSNGDVEDAPAVCHRCQRPGDLVEAGDGKHYHPDCVPEDL